LSRPEATREGFATLGLDEIVCIFEADNTRSGNVAERLGKKFDRVTSLSGRDQRAALDVQLCRLTRHQWETTNRASTPD